VPSNPKFSPNEKVVFSGGRWDVYQWPQTLFDGKAAVFEGAVRLDSAFVIASCGGKILYSIQEQAGRAGAFYGAFGGVVDRGEDPLAAAKRELLEESGYESDDWRLLSAAPATDTGQIRWTTYVYLAKNCRKSAEQNLDPGEKIEVMSASPEEFIRLVGTDEWREKGLAKLFYSMAPDTEKEAAFLSALRQ
jgi:ADP-ribose pyrophosphatase